MFKCISKASSRLKDPGLGWQGEGGQEEVYKKKSCLPNGNICFIYL